MYSFLVIGYSSVGESYTALKTGGYGYSRLFHESFPQNFLSSESHYFWNSNNGISYRV